MPKRQITGTVIKKAGDKTVMRRTRAMLEIRLQQSSVDRFRKPNLSDFLKS